MASAAPATGWLRGRVKAVPSGDCLVIMGSTKAEIPPEKTITLSSLMAPRLVSVLQIPISRKKKLGERKPFIYLFKEKDLYVVLLFMIMSSF